MLEPHLFIAATRVAQNQINQAVYVVRIARKWGFILIRIINIARSSDARGATCLNFNRSNVIHTCCAYPSGSDFNRSYVISGGEKFPWTATEIRKGFATAPVIQRLKISGVARSGMAQWQTWKLANNYYYQHLYVHRNYCHAFFLEELLFCNHPDTLLFKSDQTVTHFGPWTC